MRPRHAVLAVLVAVVWGVNFVVIDVGLRDLPPLLFVAVRFVVAAFPAILVVRRPRVPLRWIVAIGLTIGAGQFGFVFTAIQLGMPAGLASLVLQAQAPFTLLLGLVILRERVTALQVGGLVVALAGFGLVGAELGGGSSGVPAWPFVLTLLGGLSWAYGNLAMRHAGGQDPLALMVWVSLVPPIPMAVLSLVVEGPAVDLRALANVGWAGVGAVAYVAYLATLLGYGLWGFLLRRYPAGRVAVSSLLVPIVGMSASAVFLHERFGPVRLAAAALVIAGVALSTLRPRVRGPGVRPDPQPSAASTSSQTPTSPNSAAAP